MSLDLPHDFGINMTLLRHKVWQLLYDSIEFTLCLFIQETLANDVVAAKGGNLICH